MKMKLLMVVAVLACLSLAEGRFPKFRFDKNGKLAEESETESKLTSEEKDTNEENLKKRTKAEEDDDTLFHATKLRSNISGKKMYTLWEERTIYAYQGFRYATAERFLPPTDQGKYWTGRTFEADHIGLKCPQGSNNGGDEDCLFLNVYTPYKPGSENATGLAVMFFIHGGAFVAGNAASYLPTKLLNHDVILVTIHYRLGIFGFYTHDTPSAPGNLALYDMISALRWVKRYISDFGGSPDLVTIFGESAGSVSVNYMMLLTKNQNLFRAAIAESGSALDPWALDEDTLYASREIERQVNCNISEVEDDILQCMRDVPAQDLVNALSTVIKEDRRNGLIGFRGCSPTIQTFNDKGLSFNKIFDKEPREYFLQKKFKDVPFLTGANREEGSLILGVVVGDYLFPNKLINNKAYLREEMLRKLLLSVGVKDEPESLAKSLQNRYCDGVDLGNLEEAQYCLIDIGGILFLKAGSWETSNYHSYYSKHLTYYYSFEFQSDDSVGEIKVGNHTFYGGVAHADELKYLFSGWAVMDNFEGQEAVCKRMTLLWTNFARYLNPTPNVTDNWKEMNIPEWTPYLFEDPHFMLMDAEFSVQKDFADRWTITNDRNGPPKPDSVAHPNLILEADNSQTTVDPDECTGKCADYEDQRDAFMITMIVFIVAFVIATLGAIYFFFKARK